MSGLDVLDGWYWTGVPGGLNDPYLIKFRVSVFIIMMHYNAVIKMIYFFFFFFSHNGHR